MELKQISDRIFYLPSSPKTDRPVLGYIRGDRYSVMVDSGNSPEHVEIFNQELKKRGLSEPELVVITHWHWDHSFGMSAVKGKVIVNSLTNDQLNKVKEWEWSEEAMAQRLKTGEDIEFCDRCIRLEYPDRSRIKVRTADIIFDRSLVLELGGIHCTLNRIIAPHSEDSTTIYIPEEKVLFVGDADGGDYYHNDGKYDKRKVHELIQYLESLDFSTYIIGHDEPVDKEDALEFLYDELNN